MGLIISIFLLISVSIGIFYYSKKKKYDNSNYKKESGNEFKKVWRDTGNYGEYLTFNELEKIKGDHRILTNVYLPKENGETTEVDLIYIHETGIYVLESKNYSGWIFGDEKSRNWMQTLKNGRKEKFYNPIMQNNTHIKYLIKELKVDEKYIKSIIVFSDRCTLKKIEVNSENVKVINRYNVNKTMGKLSENSPNIFPLGKIIELYYELKPYTCVSNEEKLKHIENINLNIKPKAEKVKFEDENAIKKPILDEKNTTICEIQNESNTILEELNDNNPIYKQLKEYRLNKSKEENVKPYFIYNNGVLEEIIKQKPKTIDELGSIRGFGNVKCSKYGEDVVRIVSECCIDSLDEKSGFMDLKNE